MIIVKKYEHEGVCTGFNCSGHAGFADEGQDIVCASVTSALQLTVNGITEVLKQPAKVDVRENEIEFLLSGHTDTAIAFLDAFMLHLRLLAEEYPKNIRITNLEV